MPNCCVPLCKAKASAKLHKEQGITFHRFPNKERDRVRHQKWIENINREDLEQNLSMYSSICSKHFVQEMFDRTGPLTRLREYALPTLFEHSNQPVKHQPVIPHDVIKASSISLSKEALSLDHSYYIADSPRKVKRKLEGQIEVLRKKLKTRQTRLSKYEKKIRSLKYIIKKLKSNMYTITRNF